MSDQLFEHAVRDWLEDGSDRTPRPAIEAVLLAVKTTPQERGLRIPRRFTLMPAYLRLAAVAAVVAVVGVGALTYIGGNPGAGGNIPPATPAPTASHAATPAVTTPARTDPPLSQTFNSSVHGFSISHPDGWTVEHATGARSSDEWEADTGPVDIHDFVRAPGASTPNDLPGSAQFVLRVTSIAAPEGVAADTWISENITGTGGDCLPPAVALVDIDIDGRRGSLRDSCGELEATVVADGRIYVFTLFVNASVSDGRAMFEALAETITLRPAEALTSPRPS
jgi:hypothetical protein